MKLQVFMVLWSVLKSALALGSRFVATSQFICIVGLLTGFCMVRGFGWQQFWNRFLKYFLRLLTIFFKTFWNLQVTSFRTFSQTFFIFHVLYVICINYVLKISFSVFISDILANLNFLLGSQSNTCGGAILQRQLATFGR